jgi:hypothetical protein
MDNVGIFYGHLEYLTAMWYISWPFGTFFRHFNIFSRFGMFYQEKSGNPSSPSGVLLTGFNRDAAEDVCADNKNWLRFIFPIKKTLEK